jgi:hypothetical protein
MTTTTDGLEHDALATAIVSHMDALPVGSVIAIQGPWGRGKTDVLRRVQQLLRERSRPEAATEILWLNPWQYGSPNLIAPLVVQLLERVSPSRRSGNEKLRRAVQTLLRAGNAIAFKALSVVVPFGEVLQAGKDPVDDLIGQLFEPAAGEPLADFDPVDAMARRFRDLVDEYLDDEDGAKLLVVCVDDLDRCLPDHQIAMLEAMHFLTAAGARAYFVVALDPMLVQQAAVAHYAGLGFDTEQYLNKLFDLRINLHALRLGSLDALIELALARDVATTGESVEGLLTRALDVTGQDLRSIFHIIFSLPELTNPRFVSRVLDRLTLAARMGSDPLPAQVRAGDASAREIAEALIRLVVLAERWPGIRSMLQASSEEFWQDNLEHFVLYYDWDPRDWTDHQVKVGRETIANATWFFGRLPDKQRHPDVGQFLYDATRLPKLGTLLFGLDQRLVACGL